MTCCTHCRDAEALFGPRTARRDLRRYRRRGPGRATRALLDAVRSHVDTPATLLDVGGGVGALHHELLRSGFTAATHVDASAAYLDAARAEAERLGHAARVDFVHGDFVELVDTLADADVVTLDRVICCYPDVERLIDASLARARRACGLVYPREHVINRTGFRFGNLWFRLRGSAFRAFVHPVHEVDARIRGHGLRRAAHALTPLWHVALYTRGAGGAG